jgi:hypothetical protein
MNLSAEFRVNLLYFNLTSLNVDSRGAKRVFVVCSVVRMDFHVGVIVLSSLGCGCHEVLLDHGTLNP